MASTFVLPVLMGWQIRKSHHSVQYQLVTQTDSENQPPNDLARGGTENPSLSRPMIWRGEATKPRRSTRLSNELAITNIKKKSGGLNFFGKGPMAEKLQCRFRVFFKHFAISGNGRKFTMPISRLFYILQFCDCKFIAATPRVAANYLINHPSQESRVGTHSKPRPRAFK